MTPKDPFLQGTFWDKLWRPIRSRALLFTPEIPVGHGEVRVYRGTGVSRGVQRTTWDRSLKNWELQIPCFEEFLWGGNTLGLVPASLPHALGYACTFYAPTSPPPIQTLVSYSVGHEKQVRELPGACAKTSGVALRMAFHSESCLSQTEFIQYWSLEMP